MISSARQTRYQGLDVIRSLAIIFVILSHIYVFFEKKSWYTLFIPLFHFMGFAGVEIFFVLSGFLIGGILKRTDFNRPKQILNFYVRRFLRTWPLYYFVVFFLLLVGRMPVTQDIYKFFFFLQNPMVMIYETSPFLQVSWSLVIEEWFYILMPLLMLFLLKSKLSSRKSLLVIYCMLFLMRAIGVYYFKWDYTQVRYIPYLRFDGLFLGLLLSYFEDSRFLHIHKNRLMQIFGVLFIFYFIYWYQFYAFAQGSLFLYVGLLFLHLCTALGIFIFGKSKIRCKCVAFFTNQVALLSYTMYLIHLDIINFVKSYRIGSWQAYLTSLLLIALCAFILQRRVELPFLTWRDKVFPNREN